MFIRRQPKAEPEFRVVFEKRVRPGWSAPLVVLGPWRHRKITAIDRRTARRIGDLQAIAEQLREKFQIRGLPAAGASSREFKQRLQKLHAPHVGEIDARTIVNR